MRILGIDPGSLVTGFGVVELVGDRLVHVAHGTIRPARGMEMHQRLAVVFRELERIIEQHQPERAAIERVFVAASAKSALVLGQARGVALAALGRAALPVQELAAREIKKAVAGTGSATKEQVQVMVAKLLELDARPASDAADALAGAICALNASRLADIGFTSRRRKRQPAGRRRADLRTGRLQ